MPQGTENIYTYLIYAAIVAAFVIVMKMPKKK